MSKDKYFEKALKYVRKTGHHEVKANYESDSEDFELPTQFTLRSSLGGEDTFTPDITAIKYGNQSYFEISLKDEDVQRTVSKWKLMATLATRKGGKLVLMAPKGHKAFTENLVKEYRLNAEVHYLN